MKQKPVIPLLILLASACFILSTCQKEFSIETNQNLAAQGTLQKDSLGNCSSISVSGTYYGGIEPGRDTAFVTVTVDVTNAGTYSIYTTIQNGFYFSDSGYFTNTGTQTVTLRPVGAPIIPGAADFSVTFDSSVCNFTINVQDSTGTGLGGGGGTGPNASDSAWTFTGPAGSYNGPIDTAYTFVDSSSQFYLYVIGFTQATHDTAVEVGVYFSGGAITPGTYHSTNSSLFSFLNGVTGNAIYSADPTVSGTDMSVIITSYDASTRIVTGTFSGTAKDAGGNVVTIPAGAFTAKLN